MEGNGKFLTVTEAADFIGTSMTTVYRYIRKGKLCFSTMKKHGKNIKVISKDAIEDIFQLGDISTEEKHEKTWEKHGNIITPENLNEAIQEAILTQQKNLTKPLEQQAMYLAGKYQSENKFLNERLETVLQELDKYKALSGPPEEVQSRLEELEKQNKNLQTEQEDLQAEKYRKEQEIEKLKETVKSQTEEEKDLIATIEALKTRLEEEEKTPWWKKLFS